MGRTGSCYYNARAESFFATLKKEIIYRLPLSCMTKEEVRAEVFDWIEGYYNKKRRNTANDGKQPPLVKHELYNQHFAAA